MDSQQSSWDVFISHASEDRSSVAIPLAALLGGRGVKVWLDRTQLALGDSLSRKIDEGLANSRYGVVILSQAFFSKDWPQVELAGLTARQTKDRKVILPVWHGVDREFIARFSPILADKLAAETSAGLEQVANQIIEVIGLTAATTQTPMEPAPPAELAKTVAAPLAVWSRITTVARPELSHMYDSSLEVPSLDMEVSCMAFSPGFGLLALGGQDKEGAVVKLIEGSSVKTILREHVGPITALAWNSGRDVALAGRSQKKTSIVVGSADGYVVEWEPEGSGKRTRLMRLKGEFQGSRVHGIAAGYSGDSVMYLGFDNGALVRFVDGVPLGSMSLGHSVRALAFAETVPVAVSVIAEKHDLIYGDCFLRGCLLEDSAKTREIIQSLPFWKRVLQSTTFGLLTLLKLPRFGDSLNFFSNIPNRVPVSVSSKADRAAVVVNARAIILELGSGRVLDFKPAVAADVISVALSPDGQQCALGTTTGEILLCRAHDGDLLQTLLGHEKAVQAMTFASDAKLLASRDIGGALRFWRA